MDHLTAPCILCFIHPVTRSVQTAFIHIFSAFIFTSRALKLPSEPACWWGFFFQCSTCPSGLEHSNHISATLEADREAGEAVLSGRVTPGSSRCTRHTLTHTNTQSMGKTGLGPQSERPSQNQLAFKLMKRVMKRALSLLQKADRQAVG